MSADLQWLLLRKYNSFIVKRLPEGPIFSKEPGNLTNLHSHKYSGLANEKTLHVTDSGNGIVIRSRKNEVAPHGVASSHQKTFIKKSSGARRAFGITASFTRRAYRPDLRKAAISRVSQLYLAQKEPKGRPAKKPRGKAAKAAAAAAATEA